MHRRNLESDCVALLAYIWEHRAEDQTYTGLAGGTGIPYETVRQMVQWFRKDPNNWALRNYGAKYGYVVRYIGKKPYPRKWFVKPLDLGYVNVSIVLRGTTRRIGRFRSEAEARAFIDRSERHIIALERKIVDVVYVGGMQNRDGKLFVEDVAEYHPLGEEDGGDAVIPNRQSEEDFP